MTMRSGSIQAGQSKQIQAALEDYRRLGYNIKEVKPGVFYVYGPEYEKYENGAKFEFKSINRPTSQDKADFIFYDEYKVA